MRSPSPTAWRVSTLSFAALLAFASAPLPRTFAAEHAKTEETKKDDEKKWDVSNPPGPSHEVSLDVDEGTWMSLDVSPDGKEIVFDLLGDLYSVGIAGGEAKSLASGVAWDMQPRYSPDGKRIAFTSDRAGGDNIWVMDRDGSKPTQVSKETFRLLNSPTWTPDSEYVGARKHFTAGRSLGSGEIWLYHRSGGEGLQLTKKPNDQKDVGEPAFSPDGRYLYYSQDATPGATFEYNKDPNDEIYTIFRLDRVTGETQRYVTGPGGQVRPTPSPDGKSLAFVRRVRYKSVLFVRDLESGRERALWDGLERDMQETWAIHGVYPAMAWTPDNRSIVFWAGGKIRRIEIASKQVSEVPFRVRTTRRVTEALRFPVAVAPDRFPTKMLRWMSVSPKGDQLVYQALGHLYVRDLPAGTPRRLTAQKDHYEHYPSFSRDGRFIVYTTWNDDTLGSVRVAPARGGEGRALTDKPGHYLEPAFTPDGTRVVYRKAQGGFVRSPLWSEGPGLYWVATSGGRSTLVATKGLRPHFGAASDRVYLTKPEDEDKRALASIDLDGSDERSHLLSEKATEFQVSPDEKWVAFREGFAAYVVPLVPTGKRIDIGPKSAALPLRKVSKDAGEYLHWSGDSTRLHWALGPELFTQELRNVFAFLPGAPEKLPDPPVAGQNVGFQAVADVPSGSLALVGARVVTMRGDEVIEDGVVVVEKNRITAVGRRADVKVPPGAKVVDVAGRTIVPGLIDVHWHGGFGTDDIVPQRNWMTYASLAFGVTTVHDPSNDTNTIFAASEMARAGLVTAPRVYSTGTILYGANADVKAEIDSLDDALFHLRKMKAVGAFSVKSYNQPRREQRQQVVAAARQLEMMVVPEGGSLYQHNMTMVVDGHTGVEHSLPVSRIYKDTVGLWSGTKVGYTPTLGVSYGGLSGEVYWYQKTNVWENPRLLTFVPRPVVDARARRRVMAPDDEFNHISNAKVAKQLLDAGVSVQLGAHGQREGLAAHWEMWMFVQGGMTPLEALRSATLKGAAYLGLDKDLGSLEPGKLADLAVIDGNPLQDIRASEKVAFTVVNGRIYDAATMDEIGNHPNKRGTFYWEQ